MGEMQLLVHPWAKFLFMCDPMNQKTKNVLPKYNLNTYVEQTLPFKNGERERKMSLKS